VRDDALFSTIKVVSRHQATQQYGVILPIELTTTKIRNSKAYQEYYACAMGEAAPKPKASARKKKGDSASSTTPPTPTPTTTAESAPQLSTSAKGEGTGSKPGVPDVPFDDSEEELSWKYSDDEEVGSHEAGKEFDVDSDEGSDKDSDETVKSGAGKDGDEDDDEDDDDGDEEEETAKDDEKDKETDSEKESDDEEEQESRLSEEARIQEEEDAEELYRVESIFTTTSSHIVSLEHPTPIMTPSTIATITTSGEAPIPPPPTFNSAFRFEERLRLLETSFSEYRQTNQFADAVSAIPGIVHQYMDQQMKEATRSKLEKWNRSKIEWTRSRQRHGPDLGRTIGPDLDRNIATTIEQQTALDESLVPSSQRLRIRRSNFRLPSDIQSKEATLQVVYDVLRNSPLLRAFQVTADVPEIYMQEFWATAKLLHNSIRFKIDTRKSVLDLEAFREMLHISPRIPNQPFADLTTEEEVLDFLSFLGHSDGIRYLTDVNVNKLYQPWRSFASVINKCLTGKSSGVDSFRLSQAQMLWGFYHRINIDFANLIWEDFVYQVEHKSQKRSNEMNYPRFTKVIIDYFMTRKPSISRRNRIHWHYV
nr:hypothetical protein [Tanacetum cinerariifolium]